MGKAIVPLGRNAPVLPGTLKAKVPSDDKLHMIGKPTGLMRQVVCICEEGGQILESFASPGTTLVAARLEGFARARCELTQQYSSICKERLLQLKT